MKKILLLFWTLTFLFGISSAYSEEKTDSPKTLEYILNGLKITEVVMYESRTDAGKKVYTISYNDDFNGRIRDRNIQTENLQLLYWSIYNPENKTLILIPK